MRATSAFVRLFIRGLSWDAEDAGTSFEEVLKSAARGKLTQTQKGKVLVGTAANGTSVTYSLPPTGDLTDADVLEVCSVLLDKIDELRATTPDIDGDALIAAMLSAFPTVRAFRQDFSGVRS